jgi:hypothetical protein
LHVVVISGARACGADRKSFLRVTSTSYDNLP